MTRNDPRQQPGVQYVQASPSALKRLIRWVKAAGAPSEDSFPRNGFLSWHAESHAAGMGIAAGYSYFAFGEVRLVGMVYAAAVYGRAHASNGKRRRIFRDITHEPHYALGGLVLGALLGLVSRFAAMQMGVDVPALPEAPVVPEVMGSA